MNPLPPDPMTPNRTPWPPIALRLLIAAVLVAAVGPLGAQPVPKTVQFGFGLKSALLVAAGEVS